MVRRLLFVPLFAAVILVLGSGAAFACGGLVAPGHAEALEQATTLAAWHGGFEHYITGFRFAGAASSFGYIIPLPGVPAKIEKGGDWTLERLEREVNPVREAFGLAAAVPAPSARSVVVLQRVTVDALDITVVKGGGADVAVWAEQNGFDLTPDSPRVMQAYSSQGAIFALAKFDAGLAAEKGVFEGQGTVVHFTIPTNAPWIPLRILTLGKTSAEVVDADLFVLTDAPPTSVPSVRSMPGMTVKASEPASTSLLDDLRSDRNMAWIPHGGLWLTALSLHTTAGTIAYDLSIDGGRPTGGPAVPVMPDPIWTWWLAVAVGVVGLGLIRILRKPGAAPLRTA
jgi:hypothetical protein